MIQMMIKKEKTCLKILSLKIFNVIQMTLMILGEINLYVSKLSKKNAVNGVINKITKNFEKIVTVTKSKELKRYVKNILPNYKK